MRPACEERERETGGGEGEEQKEEEKDDKVVFDLRASFIEKLTVHSSSTSSTDCSSFLGQDCS